ncbi:MAG: UDP-N-acetylglucosamine 2-epimerase (hydrolyzing), partial [Phycisphaerae bacterium]|nr:UDP-N-acetylglucosamine 2-epimerase (hydrolyzing) [Phycisphaerae bacterium]
ARKQRVAVLTTARSEYYQWRPILRALSGSRKLSLCLMVSGSHLARKFGYTLEEIRRDGFRVAEVLHILERDDSRLSSAVTASRATREIAAALVRQRADLLLLLGDRYELLGAALGALCLGVPIAHIHGGEETQGAIDNLCRHAISKLSVVHFTSTEVYRRRLCQMGESPGRVFRVGAPLLDEVRCTRLLHARQLESELGVTWREPVALMTYHPVTAVPSDDRAIARRIATETMRRCQTVIVTGPNMDPGREAIDATLRQHVRSHPNALYVTNLGSLRYLSVMAAAEVLIGNSSSGIHEAASFALPVVNVGPRQAGRLRPRNVIDSDTGRADIAAALKRALSPRFRRSLQGMRNPYGDGKAGLRIVRILESLVPFDTLPVKRFVDGAEVRRASKSWRRRHG